MKYSFCKPTATVAPTKAMSATDIYMCYMGYLNSKKGKFVCQSLHSFVMGSSHCIHQLQKEATNCFIQQQIDNPEAPLSELLIATIEQVCEL